MSAARRIEDDLDHWAEAISPHTEVIDLPRLHHDTGPVEAITDEMVRAHLCPECTGHGANLPICQSCPKVIGPGGAA